MVPLCTTDSRLLKEEKMLEYWNRDGDLYRNWRFQYESLLEKIKDAGMVPIQRIACFVFRTKPKIPFYKIRGEAQAREYLKGLSTTELDALSRVLEDFSKRWETDVIRSTLGACRRQLKHQHDWRIYR